MKIIQKLDQAQIPYQSIAGHIYVHYQGIQYIARPDVSKILTKHLKADIGHQYLDVIDGQLTPVDHFAYDAYVMASLADTRKFGR